MDMEKRSAQFKALGDPTRLEIFTFLTRCTCATAIDQEGNASCANGTTVGDVCCHVFGNKKVPSTMSFHLKELKAAGLIRTKKQGKFVLCQANLKEARGLSSFLGGSICQCCQLEDNNHE